MSHKISSINFKARRKPWTELKVGMSLADVFALGIDGHSVCERLAIRHLDFDPPLSKAHVRKAFSVIAPYTRERRRELRLEQSRIWHANKTPRNCMCCRKVFPSEGRHNRICQPCKEREAHNYCPW